MLRPLLAPGRIEIASLIAYVAGTGASFVTNAAFTIDGGLSGLNDGRAFKTLDDLITQRNHRAKRRNSLCLGSYRQRWYSDARSSAWKAE